MSGGVGGVAPVGEDDVRDRLEAAIAAAGSAAAWAAAAGISSAYVSDVRLRRRPPGASVLTALGLARVVTYVPAPIDGGAL